MPAIKTVACSGHRPQHLPRDAARHIVAGVREVAHDYPGATWLTGGAIGADHVAATEILQLGLKLELVLPFPPPILCRRWSMDQQLILFDHVFGAAEVHVVSQHYDPAAYRERNRRMVDRADLLLAFWNCRPGSGTAMTVRMAEERGVPVIVVPMA